jgi:hypothetical protein
MRDPKPTVEPRLVGQDSHMMGILVGSGSCPILELALLGWSPRVIGVTSVKALVGV